MQANFVQVRIQLMVNYMCMCMYVCVCVCVTYIDIATHTVKSSEIQKINTCCENLNVWYFSYKVVLRFIECVSILAQQHSSPTLILLCFLSHKEKFGTHLKMMIIIIIIIIMRDYLSLNCLSRGVSVHTKIL